MLAVLAAFFFGTSAAVASAAAFDPSGGDWEGLAEFVQLARSELGAPRVVVTSTLALGDLQREDGVLLVHPTRTLDVDALSSFMRAGGRLALLDDYGRGDDLLGRFGIRRVEMPARPAHELRGNPAFAIAEPASAHPLVHDAARVVTNHATGLDHPGLSPLLVVPSEDGRDVLLAVAGAVGRGRLVAVGDGSIAINAMLRYPGNRAFARALVRYLVDDDVWGKRGGRLYVLVNGFETTGELGDRSWAGGLLGGARRALLDAVEGLRRDGLTPGAAYVAALALGLGLVAWTSSRVGRTHRPTTPRFARPVPVVAQGGIAGHAATLGSPEAPRVLAVLELKSALEDHLTARLGLERTPPPDELSAAVRDAHLLDGDGLRALGDLLSELARVELLFVRASHPGTSPASPASLPPRTRVDRIRDARVLDVATRVRAILAALGGPSARDRVGEPRS